MSIEIRDKIDYSTYSPLELVRLGEQGHKIKRLEIIPLSNVLTEKTSVDEGHADKLGHSMTSTYGQLTPIGTRARIAQINEITPDMATINDNGNTLAIVHDIFDGFHRTSGKKRRNEQEIDATVTYGCSDAEYIDLKILSACSIKSVQFSRVAEWVSDAFSKSPWASQGLKVSQVFGLAVSNRGSTRLINFEPGELEEMRQWALEKCDYWKKGIGTVYNVLRVAEDADPLLVKQVRTSGGGKDREGKITPARLAVVVKGFPGEKNFAAQRAILRYVVEHRLYAQETEMLTQKTVSLITSEMDEDDIYKLINEFQNKQATIKKFPATYPKSSQPEIIEEVINDNPEEDWEELEEEPTEEELAAIEQGLEPVVTLANDEIPIPKQKQKISKQSDEDETKEGKDFASGDRENICYLRSRIADLEESLAVVNRSISGNGEIKPLKWWATVLWLTPIERTVVEKVFTNPGTDFDTIAKELNLPSSRIVSYFQSALKKRKLETEIGTLAVPRKKQPASSRWDY